MGNRGGRIHDRATKSLFDRRWASKRWIACLLSFRGRRREMMGGGYTELFFLDEATAFASGHRPCFECRRDDAMRFAESWRRTFSSRKSPYADEMDAALHEERLAIFRGDRCIKPIEALPAGAMISRGVEAFLVTPEGPRRWTAEGYDEPATINGDVEILTPPSIVAAPGAGYALRDMPQL